MFSFNNLLKIALILFAITTVILIFPQKLCIPFSSNCIILTPVITLQNLIVFVGSFFLLYAFIFAVLTLFIGLIKFIITHDYFRDLFMFLVTFDEKYYIRFKSHLSGKKRVRFS